MTVLDDRPVVAASAPQSAQERVRRSPIASWALASRLARREVRRRPGRTVLVMLLVALPVIAMASASIVGRTLSEANTDRAAWSNGQADLTWSTSTGPIPSLPEGSVSTEVLMTSTAMTAQAGDGLTAFTAELLDVDLSLPITDGIVDVVDGVAPIGGGDVLLSPGVARDLGVGIGDTVRFVRPDTERQVVGLGELQRQLDGPLVLMTDFDRDLLLPALDDERTLIDLPDGVDANEFAYLHSVANPSSRGFGTGDPWLNASREEVPTRTLAWGWVAGMVAYVALGIVITAAFATSARRQLVTIGQLSATGASQSVIRRTMAMQGAWTGAVGAAFGLVVAVGGLLLADREGWIERVANRSTGPLRLDAGDLVAVGITAVVASTVAALIPARSASRIPVLTALAGRRPVGAPPRWLAPVGVGLVCVGLLLLGAAAASDDPGDLTAAVALVGALCVLFGMVGAAPLIVAGVGRLGSRRGGVVRLASRSLDRGRSRSAAVLTAIATVAALGTAGASSVGLSEQSEIAQNARWDSDLSLVTLNFSRDYYRSVAAEAEARANDGIFDRPPERPMPLPDSLRSEIEGLLPDAQFVPVERVIIDPLPIDVRTLEEVGADELTAEPLFDVTVLTDVLIDRISFTDEQLAILDQDGILGTGAYGFEPERAHVILAESGPVDVVVRSSFPPVRVGDDEAEFVEQVITTTRGQWLGRVLVTEEFVEQNGLEAGTATYWVENPVDLTAEQRSALRKLNANQLGYFDDAFVPSATAPGFDLAIESGFETWWVELNSPSSSMNWALVRLAVVLVSLAVVLFVVAVGLSLAASESREERDVLHALGAAPTTLRRVAAIKAWVLVTGAAVIAVPLGYASAFVVGRATDSIGAAPFPWVVAFALIVVIPLVTAAMTWAVSALGQRFRPAAFSTFAVD